jgi:hypothetical protein
MKWEFLGEQELSVIYKPRKGWVYSMAMWRTPVPGGWLLMTVNLRSSDPQPVTSFYPDVAHTWKGGNPPEADYLLRPATGGAISSPEQLLRAADDEDIATKQLKS